MAECVRIAVCLWPVRTRAAWRRMGPMPIELTEQLRTLTAAKVNLVPSYSGTGQVSLATHSLVTH